MSKRSLQENLIRQAKSVLRSMGWQLKKYPESPLKRRMRILETRGIDLILDVGANIGQYGEHMRELGYGEKIISFVRNCHITLFSWLAIFSYRFNHDIKSIGIC